MKSAFLVFAGYVDVGLSGFTISLCARQQALMVAGFAFGSAVPTALNKVASHCLDNRVGLRLFTGCPSAPQHHLSSQHTLDRLSCCDGHPATSPDGAIAHPAGVLRSMSTRRFATCSPARDNP